MNVCHSFGENQLEESVNEKCGPKNDQTDKPTD